MSPDETFLGKVAKFGGHSLKSFEVMHPFREGSSKSPLSLPPPLPRPLVLNVYTAKSDAG